MATPKKQQKKFNGHWSETPGLRESLDLCEEGWAAAKLTKYETPYEALNHIRGENLELVLESLTYRLPSATRARIEDAVEMLSYFGKDVSIYSPTKYLDLIDYLNIDIMEGLYKEFPNLANY